MEPITCVILIIVVIAIAALGEEISARKSNKAYSQNTNFNEIERACNLFNKYATEYNILRQQFANQYNVKIAEAQTISDIQMIKELLSYNEDFDKYSAVLKQKLENIRGMVNSRQIEHVESELLSLDEFYSKLQHLLSNISYASSSNDDFSRCFNRKKIKKNTQIPVKLQTVFHSLKDAEQKLKQINVTGHWLKRFILIRAVVMKICLIK